MQYGQRRGSGNLKLSIPHQGLSRLIRLSQQTATGYIAKRYGQVKKIKHWLRNGLTTQSDKNSIIEL